MLLLDVMMPKLDGLSAMMKIRASRNIPIIVLSAKSEDSDKILGLSMGADDYITKPYNPAILQLRISAVLKRYSKGRETAAPTFGGFTINTARGSISNGIAETVRTKNEMIIFEALLEKKGEIVSRDTIMTRLWDNEEYVNDNALTVNISRLRGKLADLGIPDAIETRKKQGYILNEV